MYICDLKIMDGLPTKDGHYVAAPLCLLYVNSSKQLVPIAIQLKQGLREEEKGQPNPIFLPIDHYFEWMLAKMYYQSAHLQVHCHFPSILKTQKPLQSMLSTNM